MPGLVPGIHVLLAAKTWMAGTSPAMTNRVRAVKKDVLDREHVLAHRRARRRQLDRMAEHLFRRVEAVDQRAKLQELAVAETKELRAAVADGAAGADVGCGEPHERGGAVAVDQKLFQLQRPD